MPDVGVLNLQIHDNSSKAAEGLDRLATALGRVKTAIGSGLKLAPIANQIKKLNESLKEGIPESSISSLERFADAVEKINASGGVKLKGMKGMADAFNMDGVTGRIQQQIEEGVGEGFRRVGSHVQQTSDQIDGMRGRMEAFNQLVQQTAWSAGAMAEQFSRAFAAWNSIRMAGALGSGNTPLLGDGSGAANTGWQQYNPWGDVRETGWTEWKDGAIEAEYTISDAVDETFNGIDQRIDGSKQLFLEAGEAMRESIEETGSVASDMAERVQQASEQIIGYKRVWNESARAWESVGYTQDEFGSRLAEAGMLSADNSQVDQAFEKTGSVMDNVKESLKDLTWLIGDFGRQGAEGITALLAPLRRLASQFGRVMRYRALRAVLKSITEGFKEGVENYYRYSQAIGSSFAPAMNSAASSLLQMKNSIGAAVAPLIQSVIPYLQMAVSWFISLVNYANQFFALMRGQSTWSRATEQSAKAFDDVKKSASGASKAVKDLLADWDELNIIQSESGGGGGGGGSTKKVQDYLGMFEEVNQFDSKVKSLMSIIESGFGSALKLAKLIGAAVLGWKISSAFDGVLGTLGRLVSGLATITIGVELGYGAGFSAGSKGFFDGADILAAIASAVAGGIGGWIMSKSASGIVIGVGISLVATLTGYISGDFNKKDAMKWGGNSLSPEEIEEYVRRQFSFDIGARIQVLDTVIENQSEARRKLNAEIEKFNESLSKIRLGVDSTPNGIQAAAESARNVIDQINQNLKSSEKNIEVLTSITPIMSENGEEDQTKEFLSGVKIADQKLSAYFTDLGKQIAHWVDEGQKTGWKNSEAEMAMELMKHQQEILNRAEQNKTSREFQVDTELNLSSMTRDNAEEVLRQQTELVSQYTEKMKTAYENQVKELFYYADLADAAGLVDEDGNPLSDAYIAMANAMMKDITSGRIYDELEPDFARMRKQWIEQLQKVYGGDIGSALTDMTGITDAISAMFGRGTYFEEAVRSALESGGTGKAAEVINEKLNGLLDGMDPHGIIRKAMGQFGFSMADLLSEESLGELIRSVRTATGDSETAIAILKAMGFSSEALANAMKQEIASEKEPWEEALSAMWDADWNTMADEELRNLVAALREKFGSDAVDQALSELDIPDADLTVPLNTTLDEAVDMGSVSVLGVETEGGWWGNLMDTLFGSTPLEKDATVHVNFDTDDGDISILDLIEDPDVTGKKLVTTGQLNAKAAAGAGVGIAAGVMGTDGTIAVTVDNEAQRGNIQTGVQNGTNQILESLRTLNQTAAAINQKNFTVSITPSAPLGRNLRTAGGMFDTVTGAVR